ncbi:MAG: DNA primase [Acidimicrobiales bacterium]|nr:DNA primase [Acidimicrobiales bacterium]
MGIVDDDVRRVRDASDIVGIVTQHTQLKKTGRQWMGLCPFHGEKSPSFSVNQEKAVFYCFGCQMQGDVIDFVREIEHLDFAGAVEYLAGKANITLRYTDTKETKQRGRRRELVESVGKAADFYHQRLLEGDDAGPARSYLRARGYDGEVVRKFRIGWAPESWDALAKHLRLSTDDLEAAGLGGRSKRGTAYDFFRARIVFPIFDERGDAVGFGGRKLPDAEGPKYKNTSDRSEVYDKGRLLYGLNWAKAEAGRLDEIIVCEGYTDVIGFHQAGVERAVATCGTAMTPDHARKLSRFAPRVVLAFDADGAGQNAAERVYAWEEEFGLRFAVAALPEGSDPGDLARSDPEALARAVAEARPFLEFRIDRAIARGDLDTMEGRALAAAEAMALVAEHPNPLVRDQYVVSIADRCRVSADEMRRLAPSGRGRAKAAGGAAQQRGGAPPSTRPTSEHQALRLLLHRPDEVAGLLHPVLFADTTSRVAFLALCEAGDLHAARAAAGGAAADLLGRLAVEDATDDDPLGVLNRLVSLAAERAAAELEAEARESGDLATYQPSISYLRTAIIELRELDMYHEAVPGGGPLEPLLRWLVEYSEGSEHE